MNKRPRNSRSERGIALMMTLGMLSLILIMAMSFSFQAQTNKMAAGNNADMVRARLLCESGLERVLASLSLTYANDPYPPMSTANSQFSQIGSSGQYYWISPTPSGQTQDTAGLETGLATDLFPPDITSELMGAVGSASWQHAVDASGDLIGRIGFFLLDEGGKIDPGAVVTVNHEPYFDANKDQIPDTAADFYSGEFYVDLDLDYTNNDYVTNGTDINTKSSYDEDLNPLTGGDGFEETNVGRITGRSPQEISIDNEFRSELPEANRDLGNGGNTDAAEQWFSLMHLYKEGLLSWANYQKYFPASHDIEAFHYGSTPTDKHRFDLSGFAWDPDKSNATSAWDDTGWMNGVSVDLLTGTVAASGGTVLVSSLGAVAPEFWVNASTRQQIAAAGGGGINWLGSITAEDGSTSLSGQVCANLVDYCDSDDDPTVIVANGTSFSALELWCGLEEVPYINELALQITFKRTGIGPPADKPGRTVDIDMAVEAINMYASNKSVDVVVAASFSVYADYGPSYDGNPNETITVAGVETFSLNVGANSYQSSGFRAFGSTRSFIDLTSPSTEDSHFSVNVNYIKMLEVDGATLLDFSSWVPASPPLPNQATPSSGVNAPTGGTGNTIYGCLEVADARANGRTSDWVWYNAGFNTSGGGADTLGAQNHNGSPPSYSATTQDPENADLSLGYPSVSTCYIRNAPMQSLWELGAIHRGEAWRTLNLKKYSDGSSTKYTDGDAQILNQVKLGPFEVSKGKFNVNSQSDSAWETLLGSVTTGASYVNPRAGSVPATAGTISEIKTGSNKNGEFDERGKIAPALAAATGSVADAEKEELIGKLANLFTARQNYFTVVAVAQSVRDTGSVNPGGSNSVSYDGGSNYCTVLSEQRILATIYRDAENNDLKIERFEFLED